MRTYEKTHPWLTFKLDLQRVPYTLWVRLGEAQSKCSHVAGVPLKQTLAEEMHKVFLAKGVNATTAIEGNTLTEEEVRQRIDGTLQPTPSISYTVQEVDNMIESCNRIASQILSQEPYRITPELIKDYNKDVLKNLKLEEGVRPGEVRHYSVGAGGYRGAPAEDCDFLLGKLCDWLNTSFSSPTPSDAIAFAVLKAVTTHIYLAWIHPFGDGNGRTARLLEFHILLQAGVPSPAAHLLTNHYNKTRQEYFRQLDYTSKSGGDLLSFLQYAVVGLVDGLREQLNRIRQQQWGIAWESYVHEQFRDKKSEADNRRRHLVLELSSQSTFVPLNKLKELTPRLATMYAGKTQKTISRDVNHVLNMGLLDRSTSGIRAKREIILAYLPPTKKTTRDSNNESGSSLA